MGDHDHGVIQVFLDLHQAVLQMRTCQGIKCTKRLIHQQYLWLHSQSSGDTDTLLHTTGNFIRALVQGVCHVNQFEVVLDPVFHFSFGFLALEYAFNREFNVLVSGQPGQQRVVLEHHGALRAWLVHFFTAQYNATLSGLVQTLVHMTHALHKRPDEISGGMKQRVGIARALAMEPQVLLMDEPFGALDALTRAHLQDSLMEIQKDLNNTVIMITHDVDEAVLLSDRIVMMTNGPAATVGEILDIELERPRNRISLADDPTYNHYRHEVLSFLYEKQRKPDTEAPAKKAQEDEKKQSDVA